MIFLFITFTCIFALYFLLYITFIIILFPAPNSIYNIQHPHKCNNNFYFHLPHLHIYTHQIHRRECLSKYSTQKSGRISRLNRKLFTHTNVHNFVCKYYKTSSFYLSQIHEMISKFPLHSSHIFASFFLQMILMLAFYE